MLCRASGDDRRKRSVHGANAVVRHPLLARVAARSATGCAIAGVITGAAALLAPAGARAACGDPLPPLGAVARSAPVVVLADVLREPVNQAGGFDATMRVRAVIKGPPPGPVVLLRDLGDPTDQSCALPPALARGGRYVLFLNGNGQGPNAIWSLVNGQAGVYQLSTRGTIAPPEVAGGKPQVLPIPPAELIRDVGTAAALDAAHVEAIITDDALAETLDQPQAAAPATKHFWQTLPLRETALAVAAAAGVLAALVYLLWRPREALDGRRP
jgi:hypothetical protein